ncbi:MAG: hypothetical protein JNK05_35850 [Myxococcales bacterium]|nr:hypothetical protein [Myxococcales bacterium]
MDWLTWSAATLGAFGSIGLGFFSAKARSSRLLAQVSARADEAESRASESEARWRSLLDRLDLDVDRVGSHNAVCEELYLSGAVTSVALADTRGLPIARFAEDRSADELCALAAIAREELSAGGVIELHSANGGSLRIEPLAKQPWLLCASRRARPVGRFAFSRALLALGDAAIEALPRGAARSLPSLNASRTALGARAIVLHGQSDGDESATLLERWCVVAESLIVRASRVELAPALTVEWTIGGLTLLATTSGGAIVGVAVAPLQGSDERLRCVGALRREALRTAPSPMKGAA